MADRFFEKQHCSPPHLRAYSINTPLGIIKQWLCARVGMYLQESWGRFFEQFLSFFLSLSL